MTLPAGWVLTTLGEVSRVVSGSTPRTTEPRFWGGDVAWITPDDLSGYTRKRIEHGARNITQQGYESCSTQLVPAGTVLYSSRAPIGYAAIAAEPVCTNQGFKSFVPSHGLESDYLYWFLRHATPEIRKLGSGTTFPELSKKSAQEVAMPLPPLAEQRRIVAAIEEQFSRLDAAGADLQHSWLRLHVLEASSLALNLDRADAPRKPLSEISSLITDGDHNPPSRVASGIPHLTAKHVKRGRLIFDRCTYVSKEGFEQTRRRYEPTPGDVIVTCVGTIGEAAVVEEGVRFSADRNLAAIRPLPGADSRYVRFALRAPAARRAMASASGSTAQPHLYLRDLRALLIPVPTLEEQRRIVAELEQQLSLIDSLRAAVEAAQKRSAALRRAILERAFRGELVPQDPDDEPASALLERIRADRAASPATKRRTRP